MKTAPEESVGLPPGSTIGGYRLRTRIGIGRTSEVYDAVHTFTERNVALKVLRQCFVQSRHQALRIQREAIVTALFRDPRLVTCWEAGYHGGLRWIALDRLYGESMRARLGQGPLRPHEVTTWGRQACLALVAMHDKGFVHRDIRPDNMFIERGSLVLIDFGSCASQGPAPDPDDLPAPIEYMAPEEIMREPADPRSDIYSLGLCLYEGLLGRHPFAARRGSWPDAELIATRQLGDVPLPLPDLVEGCPRSLWEVIERCLAKSPDARYQDAGALEAALAKAEAQLPGRGQHGTPARAAKTGKL